MSDEKAQATETTDSAASALSAMLCGCGRPVTYMTPTGDACNKYLRCLTYDEQREALKQANLLVLAYRAKRAVDGLNGRTWNASKHFEAEAAIEAMEETHNVELTGAAPHERKTKP